MTQTFREKERGTERETDREHRETEGEQHETSWRYLFGKHTQPSVRVWLGPDPFNPRGVLERRMDGWMNT